MISLEHGQTVYGTFTLTIHPSVSLSLPPLEERKYFSYFSIRWLNLRDFPIVRIIKSIISLFVVKSCADRNWKWDMLKVGSPGYCLVWISEIRGKVRNSSMSKKKILILRKQPWTTYCAFTHAWMHATLTLVDVMKQITWTHVIYYILFDNIVNCGATCIRNVFY